MGLNLDHKNLDKNLDDVLREKALAVCRFVEGVHVLHPENPDMDLTTKRLQTALATGFQEYQSDPDEHESAAQGWEAYEKVTAKGVRVDELSESQVEDLAQLILDMRHSLELSEATN